MTVVQLHLTDVSRPAQLHMSCFAAAEVWSQSALGHSLEEPGVLALGWQLPGGELAGFILGRVVADEAEILTLAVHPASRRQSIARQLVLELANLAAGKGARRLFLEVAENNHPARQLYAACGFLSVGQRAHYYSGNRAALLLALDLPAGQPDSGCFGSGGRL